MNKVGMTLAAALAIIGFQPSAQAHGCSGPGACQTIQHNPSSKASGGHAAQRQGQGQGQGQQQAANASSASAAASTAQSSQAQSNGVQVSTGSNRSFTVFPVTVIAPPIVTPSANISRYVDQTCGPRMRVHSVPVKGVNNRMMGAQEVDLGVDQEVIPDPHVTYRKVQIQPGVYQLLGHRVIETSAVLTTSTSYGFGIGGNSNNGGGGSLGVSGAGGMQQLVNTVRLQECVVATIDERPKAVPKPAPKRKKVVRKPECPVCINK